MDTQKSLRKINLVGILILFISVTIVPSINALNFSDTNYIIKKTQVMDFLIENPTCTMLVSEQQIQTIQKIFDDLKIRLSTAESPQQTQRIFNDTLIELNRYHLLPTEMTVKQVQQMVISTFTKSKTVTNIQKIHHQYQTQNADEKIQNSFCSIAGNTSNTHFAKIAKRTALRLYYIIDFNTGNVLLNKAALALFVVFNDIAKINQKILQQNGTHLGVCIYFGNYRYTPYPNWLSPSQGWISTNGVNGLQNITGSIWGQTMTGGWQPQVDWYMNYTWRGCLGFTGLIYYTGTDNAYFIGSALSVNVGPERP